MDMKKAYSMGKRRECLGPKRKGSLAQQNKEDTMAQEGPIRKGRIKE